MASRSSKRGALLSFAAPLSLTSHPLLHASFSRNRRRPDAGGGGPLVHVQSARGETHSRGELFFSLLARPTTPDPPLTTLPLLFTHTTRPTPARPSPSAASSPSSPRAPSPSAPRTWRA